MLLIPLVGSLIILSSFYSFINQTKDDGLFTDVAGRQRMLSEQIGHYTHRVYNMRQVEAQEPLREAVAVFDQTLAIMARGGEIMGRRLSPAPPEIQDEIDAVKGLWKDLKPVLLRIADQSTISPEMEKANAIIQVSIPHLRDLSNEVVSSFELLSLNRKEKMLGILISILSFNFILLLTGIVVMINYLAESKQAEGKIRESEERYRTLTEAAQDAIFIVDREDNIVFVNPFGAGLFGNSPEDLIGKPRRKMFPSDVYTKQSQTIQHVFKTGESLHIESNAVFGKREIWLSTRLVPLKNDKGEINSILGISREITENKLAQIVLKKSEDRLKEAQKVAQIGSWELGLTTNALIWSDEVYRIFNINPQEFMGTYEAFLDRIHPKDREFVNKAFTESVKNHNSYDIVHRILLKDGTIKYVNERGKTFYDETGKPVRSVGTVQDITERVQSRKKIEEALEKAKQGERVKTLFMANMSHEVRTPLNGILGFLELIEAQTRHLLDEEQQGFFDLIRNNGNRLMRTVSEILDISQIEAGTYKARKENVNLVPLVSMVVREYRIHAKQKNLKLEYISDLEIAPVRADEYGLCQAISNLLDNAIKYTEKGRVTLSLMKKAKRFILTIQDTGIGMSSEYMNRMFEAFSQESEGYTKKYQGIGLGMAIAKRHLDMNNVDLTVESTKGAGTVFTLTFQ